MESVALQWVLGGGGNTPAMNSALVKFEYPGVDQQRFCSAPAILALVVFPLQN